MMSAPNPPGGPPAPPPASAGRAILSLALPDPGATEELGASLAGVLQPGDLVTLSGDLGSGKTALARAILRALSGHPGLEVPSPTFTLLQSYDTSAGTALHADLYRIAGDQDLAEIGLEEMMEGAIVLVEWPERSAAIQALPRLDVELDLAPDGSRTASLTGSGPLAERFERMVRLQGMLDRSGWGEARRVLLQGDASSRAYERLTKPSGESAILMISPPRPDGPPVRRGRPYSAIARLAESVHAFSGVDRGLRGIGLSAPAILDEDLEIGLMLIEDFGSLGIVGENGPIAQRYQEATRLLAVMHGKRLPEFIAIPDAREHVLPHYDMEALLIEADLLLDWYLPHIVGTRASGSVRAEFGNLWRETLEPVVAAPTTWTLRDYHSPNLMWLPDRKGIARVGLLDFQDAVLGHPAYDVASLLQDARVTVQPELELQLLGAYAQERRAADSGFDMGDFAAAYAILAAQRATKILGIFARLDRRDGKPHYLAHLPRIQTYLTRDLAHPALARLKLWYETHAPTALAPPLDPAEPATDA